MTKKEIEQLALLKYPKFSSDPYNPEQDDEYYERLIWIEGYTQCQEDMADKKYTEEDVINIVNKSRETGLTAEYLILQLNKQD